MVEKGEGRGVGCGLELSAGGGVRGLARGRWHADNPRREDDVYAKVIGDGSFEKNFFKCSE